MNSSCQCCQYAEPFIPNCFHIPGYSGHLPNVNTRCGASYGADGRLIMENPCVALAPCPVLADPPIYSPPTRACYGVIVPKCLSDNPPSCDLRRCDPRIMPGPSGCPYPMEFPKVDSCVCMNPFCMDVIATKNYHSGHGLLCTKFTKSNVK